MRCKNSTALTPHFCMGCSPTPPQNGSNGFQRLWHAQQVLVVFGKGLLASCCSHAIDRHQPFPDLHTFGWNLQCKAYHNHHGRLCRCYGRTVCNSTHRHSSLPCTGHHSHFYKIGNTTPVSLAHDPLLVPRFCTRIVAVSACQEHSPHATFLLGNALGRWHTDWGISVFQILSLCQRILAANQHLSFPNSHPGNHHLQFQVPRTFVQSSVSAHHRQ